MNVFTLVCAVDFTYARAAAVAQWIRALAPQAEGWVFESRPRQTYVVKTGSDSSTDKRSANATGPRR